MMSLRKTSIQDISNRPLISIVMPMHNSEVTVEEAISSLINQSERNFELLCVDDESTDKTRDIVASIAKHDRRVRLIALAKSNAGHARNIGLSEATGKYLMFLDSDDLFDRDMLRELSSALRESNADIAICEADSFNVSLAHRKPRIRFSNHFEERIYDLSELRSYLFDGFDLAPWNKMFVREFIVCNDLSFQEQAIVNDARFTICTLASAKSIALVPHPYVAYRIGAGTSLQDQSARYPLATINAAEDAYRYIKEKRKLDDDIARNLKRTLFSLGILSLERSVTSKEDFRGVYERLRLDVAEWDLNRIPRRYRCSFKLIFKDFKLMLKHKGLMCCSPDLLYWVYSVRSNDRRWQTKLAKILLLARMIIAIVLSCMFGKAHDER